MKRYLIPIFTIILVLTSGLWTGCSDIQKQNPETNIHIQGVTVVGGDGEPIELINNPAATNPTYAQLLAFIQKDSYLIDPPAYTSGDFAEDVHNNAEAAGIRAAWVGIDIYGENEGHACNAFETTDMGIVYVDCTGKGFWSNDLYNQINWDKQAYVKIGEAYQVTDIVYPKSGFTFVVGIEEYIGEIISRKEWTQDSSKILDWVRRHDIRELGLEWVQDWMKEHEAELSRCGRILEPFQNYGEQDMWGENHHIASGWLVRTDCLEVPWFQPQTETIDVDGIPVTWKVSWSRDMDEFESLGTVTDIHIHW